MTVSSQSQKKQINLLLKQIVILTLLGIAIVVVIITSIISRQQKTLTKSHAAVTCYDGGVPINAGFATGSCEYGKNQQVIDHPDKVFYVNQEDTDCSGCILTLYQGDFPYGQCNYANPNVCRRGDYKGGCSGVCNWVCCSGKSSQDGDVYNTQNPPGSSGLLAGGGGGEGPPATNVPPPPGEQSPTNPPSLNGQPPAGRSTTTTAPTSAVNPQKNYVYIHNDIDKSIIINISIKKISSITHNLPEDEEISEKISDVHMQEEEEYIIDLNKFKSGKYTCKSVSSDSVEVSLSDARGNPIGYDRDDCIENGIQILINIKTPTPTTTKTPTPTPTTTTTPTPTPVMSHCLSQKGNITFEGCIFPEEAKWAICDGKEPAFYDSKLGCTVYRICANNNTNCLYKCWKKGEYFDCKGANDSQTGNFIYIFNHSGRSRTILIVIEKLFLLWNTYGEETTTILNGENRVYNLNEFEGGKYACSSFGVKSIRVTLLEKINPDDNYFSQIHQITDPCNNGVRISFDLQT